MAKTGERLKLVRQALGLDQTEMGKLCRVTPGTIGNWERGISSIPITPFLKVHRFGIDVGFILGSSENMVLEGHTLESAKTKARNYIEYSQKAVRA